MIKNIIIIMCVAVMIAIIGCKSVPTPAQLEVTSYAIGVSTAMICNMTKISDKDRNIIIDIVNNIRYSCPKPGQTLSDAWSDIAKAHVKELVDKQEITVIEGDLILKIFDAVISSADYMIRIKWPEIGEQSDLILAVTNGFCDGFVTYFKSADVNTFSAPYIRNYDVDAYNYLMSLKR